jgi:RNA polymerase sigma-70 factor (ECF subfamily)
MLDQMRDKYRAVFVLRHVDGMELHEIAVGLDVSLATVKRYLNKALATIHKSVSREEDPGLARLGAATPSSFLGSGR